MKYYLQSFKIPFSDWKKLGIGFILYALPFISLITGFFSWGYQLECARNAMKKKKTLPEWNDWQKLFVRGLSALVIGITYAIPSIIIALSFSWKLVKEIGLDTKTISNEQIISLIKSNVGTDMMFLIIVLIITAYITPMAITLFAKNYKFKEAFMLKETFSKAFSWIYFKAWLLIAVYGSVVSMIIQGILTTTKELIVLPLVLGAFAKMFIGISRYTLFGNVVRELK